jgi:hypothetical protein
MTKYYLHWERRSRKDQYAPDACGLEEFNSLDELLHSIVADYSSEQARCFFKHRIIQGQEINYSVQVHPVVKVERREP